MLQNFNGEGWRERPRKKNPTAQQVFIKTDFRFGFHALLGSRLLHIKGQFLPQ